MKTTYHLFARLLYYITMCLIMSAVACVDPPSESDTEESITLNIPDDFEMEDIYSVSEAGQGSWVSIAEGPDKRFYAGDQYGGLYTFIMPGIGETLDSGAVDSVALNIGYAQGLLWAFNSLYVIVVKRVDEDHPDDPSSGIYRLRDTDGDGRLDSREKILTVTGLGEHGPHTLRVGPDGESLYFIAGNFNKIPDHFTSRLPKNWGEDNLFPPYLDASGHAVDLKAPGGWLAKTDADGNQWEIIGAGMRNPFSFGINGDGELLAYDADMEWDFGMPWYRPTRILHVTSGSEFGWRTGSGKWPVYYPDNLPAVENMSQGSPTAVIMGKDLQWPSRYRNGLLACDWSFGTIYFVDIQEDGSSYSGTREEFLSGVPLPVTNAIAGSDGHLYFLTGGRRLTSHLYRVRYTGAESTGMNENTNDQAKALRATRRLLEQYHNNSADPSEVVKASWPYLDHTDRFIRYAARIALEHQPLTAWQDRLWREENDIRTIYGALAYARSGGALTSRIVDKLERVVWSNLVSDDKIALLRTYSLLFIRQGQLSTILANRIAGRLDPLFPNEDARINRELSQLLLYLEHPSAVAKTMAVLDEELERATSSHPEILSATLLKRSEQYGPQIADMLDDMPPTEAIYYVTILSHVKKGWTKELRNKYFDWFYKALNKKGGVSYKAFLDNIRAKALENVPTAEKQHFEKLSGFYSPIADMADLPKPIGPGINYNTYDLGRIATWGNDNVDNYEGNITKGRRAFDAALCSSCHRMKGQGGISGPDLSNLHTRFNKGEIAKAILSPNEEISDQYAFTVFNLKDGDKMVGRIVEDAEDFYKIYQSPYDMQSLTTINKSDVQDTELSAISPMPAKLLNALNSEEVLDLMVYLLAGGDEGSELYQ